VADDLGEGCELAAAAIDAGAAAKVAERVVAVSRSAASTGE
jgi:anthranilate phosphoribosyltransferase